MKNPVLKAHVTEKTVELTKENKFTFLVSQDASKKAVKRYVENIFNVDVVSVNTLRTSSKPKRDLQKGFRYRKAGLKKAIVQLKDGQNIDLFETESE